MRLNQVSAVITGAAGGIGDPLCRRLLASGARLLLVGRSAERLGRLARVLGQLPYPGASQGSSHGESRDRIDVLAVDLTTPAGRQAVHYASAARCVNLLVHCAAVPSFGPLASLDDAHVEQVINTDLIAPIALTRLMVPVLQSMPEASILSIGSTLGGIGVPGFTVYGAAKAGLQLFSEALRRELSGSSVRVQYLGARATRTGFNDARVDAFNDLTGTHCDAADDVARAAVAMIISGRGERHLGSPERLFLRLNALVPTWIDGGFRRHRLALARVSQSSPDAPTPSVALPKIHKESHEFDETSAPLPGGPLERCLPRGGFDHPGVGRPGR